MGHENVFLGIFVCLIALFPIAAAYFNWDFFFNNRKAWLVVKIFGRNGARIFYGLLGGFVFIMGIMSILG